MACPRCGSTAPAPQGICTVCGLRLDSESPTVIGAPPVSGATAEPEAITQVPRSGATGGHAQTGAGFGAGQTGGFGSAQTGVGGSDSPTSTGGVGARSSVTPLTVGQDFGSRYHIIKLLGVGGMGAVYQGWDKTLEVAVAVKVVRPPTGVDAAEAEAVEKRFKRELLLARQVTHRNVVRIHDLGEIDGITYITMPYVQGQDLSTMIKKEGRIPVDQAISIMKQVAAGLVAAHEAGVVHRDLKPANIMVEPEGHALIMDFGIARSVEAGMTMTVHGAVIGTLEYMAPEQATGGNVDQRADIYAFGLMLNDALLGKRQGGATTAMASLMQRMQAPPQPLRAVDPSMPAGVESVVTKCLQPDPNARYQKMSEVLADLDLLDPAGEPKTGTTITAAIPAPSKPLAKPSPIRYVIAAGVLVAVAAGAWFLRDSFGGSSSGPVGPPVSIAILPFKNSSGDPALDSLGTNLSQELTVELGQASRVRAVPQDRIRQVMFKDMHFAANAELQSADVAAVADFVNAKRVLSGDISRLGDTIRINATLQNLEGAKQSTPLTASAPNQAGVMAAIADLADKVRQELGRESRAIANDLKSRSSKPSTTSFEALNFYNDGLRLTQQGQHQEAEKKYLAATEKDGNFALAYSALAGAYQQTGQDSEMTAADQKAMSLAESLPPTQAYEKYLIQANHYSIINDAKSALEAYENLAKESPNDAALQYKLGVQYENTNVLDQAEAHFSKVVELDPKDVTGLNALGRVSIKAGRPQQALDPLSRALAIATQFKNDPARGDILQAMGVAYKRLTQMDEALKNYTEALAIRTQLGNKSKMAGSLSEIALVQKATGKPKDAEKSFQQAMALQREIGDNNGLAGTLVNLAGLLNDNLGRPDDALPLLREALQIQRGAKTPNPGAEASVLNAMGVAYLAKGNFGDAQTNFESALTIREKKPVPGEMADTLHNLAETQVKAGRYDEALKQYERAIDFRRKANDKRGEAIESYSMGTIFDYMGRYGAAVKAKQDALTTFRDKKFNDMWLGEILSGHGNSLALSGKFDDAAKSFDEANTVGRDLKNASLLAQTSRFEADRLSLMGNATAAVTKAGEAQQAAAAAQDKSLTVMAKATAAIAELANSATSALAGRFAALSTEADALGLKALSAECLVHAAETSLKANDRAGARTQADKALARAQAGNFRLLVAKARYVKAETLRQAKDAAATAEYQAALRVLNDLKAEDGNADVVKRADVATMYADCQKWAKGA